MSNFKSGSGDLNFGDDDETEKDDTVSETTLEQTKGDEGPESASMGQSMSDSSNKSSDEKELPSRRSVSDEDAGGDSAASRSPAKTYPYFVRRNNVGDERDNRLEIHVRDKVTSQEAKFRSELAEYLGADEIPKTDAREFALLTAFHHPKRVAELMRDEGFGDLH